MPFSRFALAGPVAVAALLGTALGPAAHVTAVEPTLFELVINGETFTVEANRVQEVVSPEDPDRKYRVAVRVAPRQRLKLNAVQFDYDRLCEVQDDRGREQRTARLTHELGFSMLVTDLGASPLSEEGQRKAIRLLTESVVATFREQEAEDLEVGKPRPRRFGKASGLGATIHYRDAENLGRTCHVYVLDGPEFAVSCVVQYLDHDLEEVRDLIGLTLNSLAPVP